MLRHWSRSLYYVLGKGLVKEPDYLLEGCPHAAAAVTSSNTSSTHTQSQPIGKYGFMFRNLDSSPSTDSDCEMVNVLIELGRRMNLAATSTKPPAEESSIPSGYTYLGQFIAHEVSFDKTKAPPFNGVMPSSFRSPQIDLDSIYGLGPTEEYRLYQDRARLKIGETIGDGFVKKTFLNDLPRRGYGRKIPKQAVIADPRNDDNLALAQTQVAFIKFHNAVVDRLQRGENFRRGCPLHPNGCPPRELFKCARREVVQHFQAIILYDFLPTILHESALECTQTGNLRFFNTDGQDGVFMPLEFSAAAFRFGHSMVRDSYEWNYFHCSEDGRSGAVPLAKLFQFTKFSGNLGGAPRLQSEWIIDWRRFFDFDELGYPSDVRKRNKARKVDTAFDLHLDAIPGYPHKGFGPPLRSITVRNLLRGYSLGLPSGEMVAEQIDPQQKTKFEVADEQNKDLLNSPVLRGKTPLWYYVLREAEQKENNGRLGPIASCIVAETLVGLIKKSPYSILNDPEWLPKFGDAVKNATTKKYRMIDLLDFAGTVDPIGDVTVPPYEYTEDEQPG